MLYQKEAGLMFGYLELSEKNQQQPNKFWNIYQVNN